MTHWQTHVHMWKVIVIVYVLMGLLTAIVDLRDNPPPNSSYAVISSRILGG
jgi:hypothetical protein